MHSHILPGLDDGAADWEQALAMARAAADDGITEMVCTPHWVPGKYDNDAERVLPRFAEFKARLSAEQIPLKVHSGAELRIDTTLLPRLQAGEILTINNGSGYILLELPDESLPSNLEDFFWQLQLGGYRPILSHVERNPIIKDNPRLLFDWVEKGILTQISAASLQPDFPEEVQAFSLFLMEHRLAHMLVTDAHGLRLRRPELSEAFNVVERLIGRETAVRMTSDTPARILRGEQVPIDDPIAVEAPKPKRRFWLF